MLKKMVLLFSSTMLVITAAFSILAIGTLSEANRFSADLEQSIKLTFNVSDLHIKPGSANLSDLKNISKELKPEFRSTLLDNVIKTPSSKNITAFVESEKRYQEHIIKLHDYFIERTRHQASISLFALLLLNILGAYFMIRKIFEPIGNLDAKMHDFLANRYSYEFSVPSEDEVGRLHASFNLLAQKVLSQIEELKGLDKAKSEFLSIASHELRTPLTSIKGSLSLLKAGVIDNLNTQSQNLLGIALNETDRLIRLINELLDLAKIEAGKFTIQKEWVPASDIIQNVANSLGGLAQTAGIEIKTEVSSDLEVFADHDRVQQIITNLTSNAIKFSPKNSVVKITCHLADNGAHFSVIDQGRGIAPEDLRYMFKKFSQASNAKNPLVKGTGLGLAIAKALVDEHGGLIGVDSQVQKGSTFWFTLPETRLSRREVAS